MRDEGAGAADAPAPAIIPLQGGGFMGRTYLYIGNRKPGDSAEGIAAYAYDEATGALTNLRNQT